MTSVAGASPRDLMRGAPPAPGRLVTLDNWQDAPFNRWSYLHVREIVPTAAISRGGAPVTTFARDERDVGEVRFAVRGKAFTVRQMLERRTLMPSPCCTRTASSPNGTGAQ